MESTANLDALLRPRSVAIVGASANPDRPGHDYLRSLIDFGFRGAVYPIHPREQELLGLKVYPDLRAVPGEVDYVISCIPAEGVLDMLDACGEKRVRAVQLFTGRFSETGREDAVELEREVLRRARKAAVRLIGPNCMGLHDPEWGLSFRLDLPRRVGPAAFISQSGNNTTEVLLHSDVRGVGYRLAVSYGNALDLGEAELLAHLAQDDDTTVIGAYIEGVRDGRRFLDALRTAAAAKPVVIMKGGRTSAGARSAVSHTAALAGSREVWQGALRQAGALQVDTQEELIDLLVAFTLLRRPEGAPGRRVGVVGGGGGRAVQAADACTDEGLVVPPLTDDIRHVLRERAPQLWDWIGNPVDQSILAGAGRGVSGASILELMLESAEYDLFIANVGEDWVMGRPDFAGRLRHIVERFAAIGRRAEKPIAFVLGPADSPEEERWRAVEEARSLLVEAGLAVFPTVERAAWALSTYAGWWEERADV
ncbi:MAG: CoA-binding protein [Chloroflexi bacterium]|nr:CoA-binding protein [Chloroflexota bacterium]